MAQQMLMGPALLFRLVIGFGYGQDIEKVNFPGSRREKLSCLRPPKLLVHDQASLNREVERMKINDGEEIPFIFPLPTRICHERGISTYTPTTAHPKMNLPEVINQV